MEKKEKNSRIVIIKPTMHNAPITDEKSIEVQEWLSAAVTGVNVRHESRTKPVPYTGLTLEQERLLIPDIIDIDRDSLGNYIDFNRRKKEFYNGLLAFPSYQGLVLEIGLTLKNDSTISPSPSLVSETNRPYNVEQYVKWRALFENDPRCAKNKEQSLTSRNYSFYIIDEVQVVEQEEKQLDLKEDAMRHYLTINTDVKELKKMIILMEAGTLVLRKDENDITKLKMRLSKLMEADPSTYSKFATDPDIDSLLLLQRLMNYKIVEQRTGGAFYDENTKMIADNKAEMIKWLKDAENITVVTSFKRLLQEKSQLQQ